MILICFNKNQKIKTKIGSMKLKSSSNQLLFMLFIANCTNVFSFFFKVSLQVCNYHRYSHIFRKGIKKSYKNSCIIIFVYLCFRRKCHMQRQSSGALEVSANCNIYGAANTKFKRMFTLVYESYRSK